MARSRVKPSPRHYLPPTPKAALGLFDQKLKTMPDPVSVKKNGKFEIVSTAGKCELYSVYLVGPRDCAKTDEILFGRRFRADLDARCEAVA
jgi:hypothetical protein